MHDIRYIRNHPDEFARKLARRGLEVDIDLLLNLDGVRREAVLKLDRMREKRNTISQEIGRRKKSGDEASELREEMIALGGRIKGT
ncbi:MAG TPA: serine--tRNA ligase, partial [Bacteroidetes bacterium]|nr:serine--tRNA ligase [Bacteroidota bacterium]